MHATRPTQLKEFEADLLGVALASPAFLLSTVDLDATQAPLSVGRTVIRGDKFRFSSRTRAFVKTYRCPGRQDRTLPP